MADAPAEQKTFFCVHCFNRIPRNWLNEVFNVVVAQISVDHGTKGLVGN